MLLELAEHDGDVDRAIELLMAGEHPRYGAVIDRLRAAGREAEVIGWVDRAVEAGRVSGHLGSQGRDFWLDPSEVAQTYHAVGRGDDDLAVLRAEYSRRAGAATLAALVSYAEKLDRAESDRAWAIEEAIRLAFAPYGNGAALVDIALAADDLDAAWRWAEEFGAGQLGETQAKASEASRPRQAADVYRQDVDAMLVRANTKVYRKAAKKLVKVRELYDRAGDADVFAAYVGELRETYARRPSLMAAFDRAGL